MKYCSKRTLKKQEQLSDLVAVVIYAGYFIVLAKGLKGAMLGYCRIMAIIE